MIRCHHCDQEIEWFNANGWGSGYWIHPDSVDLDNDGSRCDDDDDDHFAWPKGEADDS